MIPWFQYTVIQLGPIPIQVWGLWVALGMILTFFIIAKRSKPSSRAQAEGEQGANPNEMLDLALWIIIGGFIGARLGHIFFYEPHYYFLHPFDSLKVWQGGLSSFGGLSGAAAVWFLFVKKKKIPRDQRLALADLLSFAALFGWMVGRVGCFMIHDHLGVNSNFPLAIQTSTGPRLEMALMEILGLVPLAIIFFILRRKKLPAGWYTSVLFMYYGGLRFILDFYRATDIPGADARYGGLTPGQYAGIILVFIGLYIGKKQWRGRIVA